MHNHLLIKTTAPLKPEKLLELYVTISNTKLSNLSYVILLSRSSCKPSVDKYTSNHHERKNVPLHACPFDFYISDPILGL